MWVVHWGSSGEWGSETRKERQPIRVCWTSLAVQWLRLPASDAGDMGSIPGQETKIPHAMRCSQIIIKKKNSNATWEDIKKRLCSQASNCWSQVEWDPLRQSKRCATHISPQGKTCCPAAGSGVCRPHLTPTLAPLFRICLRSKELPHSRSCPSQRSLYCWPSKAKLERLPISSSCGTLTGSPHSRVSLGLAKCWSSWCCNQTSFPFRGVDP